MTESFDPIPPLTHIYWYLVGSCNLRCRHCWIDPDFGSKKKYLAWEKVKPVFEEAKELGLKRVKLTGGEPLLHPEFCQILLALKDMSLRVSLETNGTLVGRKEALSIKETECFVAISLDGPSADIHDDLRNIKGAFEKTLRGMSHLKKQEIRFQVILSLYRKNQSLLKETAILAEKFGARSLKINVINEYDRSRKMAANGELLSVDEICNSFMDLESMKSSFPLKVIFDIPPVFKPIDSLRDSRCMSCGVKNILGLLHDGRVSLCGIGEHMEQLNFGSVLNGELRHVWRENAFLNSLRRDIPQKLEGVCGRCMLRNYCLGKCVAHNFYEHGNIFGSDVFCQRAFDRGIFPQNRLVSFSSGQTDDGGIGP